MKQFSTIAKKGNLFVDKILPSLLDHLCKTERAPADIAVKWTELLSEGAIQSKSPMQITEKGAVLFNETGLSKIFEKNKAAWVELLRKEHALPITKYDLENTCIQLTARLWSESLTNPNSPFDAVKNYLFEHPNSINTTTIYALLGISLRDYIIKDHSDMVK